MDYLFKLIAPFGEEIHDGMIGLDDIRFGIVDTPSGIEFAAIAELHEDTIDRRFWLLLRFFIAIEFQWLQLVQQIPELC